MRTATQYGMSSRCAVLVLFVLVGCGAAVQPPAVQTPPAAQTPPPPIRNALRANVEGTVVDADGRPVRAARVTVRAAEASCERVANSAVVVTDENGRFATSIDFGVGPEIAGCVVVEASAAGSRASMTRPVLYVVGDRPENLVSGELILPRVTLDDAKAMQIVEQFRATLHVVDPNVEADLATYFRLDVRELNPRLNDVRRYLRGIERIEPLGNFTYRLHGAASRSRDLRVVPGALPRLELP